MDADEHWRRVYEAKRADEVSWYQPVPEASLDALDRLGIGPETSLVDVGGGASSLVDALLDRGWKDLTVVDIAAPALAASQERLGTRSNEVDWRTADIRRWRPDRQFGVWHDRAVFHFLTEPDDRAAYLQAMLAATHAGSHVVIATFAPNGPEQCSGLPVRRYDCEMLGAELGAAFSPVDEWRQAHVTPWGATQSFQWCAFRRD
jgi:SAM-dependent methyltransferase